MCHYNIICRRHRDQDQLVRSCRKKRQTRRCPRRTTADMPPNLHLLCSKCVKSWRRNADDSDGELEDPQWMKDLAENPSVVSAAESRAPDPFPWLQPQSSLWSTLPSMRPSPLMAQFGFSNNGGSGPSDTSWCPPRADDESHVPSYLREGNPRQEEENMYKFISNPDTNLVVRQRPESQTGRPAYSESQPLQTCEASSSSSSVMSPTSQLGSPVSTVCWDAEMIRQLGLDEEIY